MSILNLMNGCVTLRTFNGLILNERRRPFIKEELEIQMQKIRSGGGNAVYHHLNEETNMLSRYERKVDGTYFMIHACRLTLVEARRISLRYEVRTGLDLRTLVKPESLRSSYSALGSGGATSIRPDF